MQTKLFFFFKLALGLHLFSLLFNLPSIFSINQFIVESMKCPGRVPPQVQKNDLFLLCE